MTFIQIIDAHTSRADEMAALTQEMEETMTADRTVRRSIRTQDRDDPTRFVVMVFFDSYESAMENSNLPETQAFSKKMMELVDGPPTFSNLDVVEDKSF